MPAFTDEELRIVARLVDQTAGPMVQIQRNLSRTEQIGARASSRLTKGWQSFANILRGNVLSTVARLAATFTGLAAIATSTAQAREFSTAMSEVATIVDTATVSMDELRSGVLEVAKAQGQNEATVARGLYQAISAGAEAGAESLRVLSVASRLAIAGVSDTATTVDVLTSAVNSYETANLSAERAADVLFQTVRVGKTTVDELAGGIGQVLPLASSLGVSFEEVNAAVAALTLGGLSTSEAVTSLRTALSSMLNVTEAGLKVLPDAVDLFSETGISARGLAETLRLVGERLGGNTNAIRQLFPDAQGLTGVLSLLNDGGERLTRVLGRIQQSTGAVGEAFEKRLLDPALRLSIALNRVRIEFVERTGGAILRAFVEIEKRAGGIEKLLGTVTVVAETLGAVAGEALKVFALLLAKIRETVDALGGPEEVARRIRQSVEALSLTIQAFVEVIAAGFQGFAALIASLPDLFRAARNELSTFSFDAEKLSALLEANAEKQRELQNRVLTTPEGSGNARRLFVELADLRREQEFLERTLADVGGKSADALIEGIIGRLREPGDKLNAALVGLREQFSAIFADAPALVEEAPAAAAEAGRLTGQAFIDAFSERIEQIRDFARQALDIARIGLSGGIVIPVQFQAETEPRRVRAGFDAFGGPGPANPGAFGPGILQGVAAGISAAIEGIQRSFDQLRVEQVMERFQGLFFALEAGANIATQSIISWANGFRSGREALEDFARRFFTLVAEMILRATLLQGILALLGGTGSVLGRAFGQATGLVAPGSSSDLARGFAGAAAGASGDLGGSPRLPSPFPEAPSGGRVAAQAAGGSSGSPGASGALNVFIQAVDARSFLDLAATAPDRLAAVVLSGVEANPQLRAAFGVRGGV